MTRRKAVGVRMPFDVGQAEWLRRADQLAEHASPARQRADVAPGLLIDAEVDEALELMAVGVQHPERRVLGPGQLAGRLDHRSEDHLEVELREQCGTDLDEPAVAACSRLDRVAFGMGHSTNMPFLRGKTVNFAVTRQVSPFDERRPDQRQQHPQRREPDERGGSTPVSIASP